MNRLGFYIISLGAALAFFSLGYSVARAHDYQFSEDADGDGVADHSGTLSPTTALGDPCPDDPVDSCVVPPPPPPVGTPDFDMETLPYYSNQGANCYKGHILTLGNEDYNGLLESDYAPGINPKQTKFSYCVDESQLSLALHWDAHRTANVNNQGHIFGNYGPKRPDQLRFRLPNTTAETSNWKKWDFYLMGGAPDISVKFQSANRFVAAIDWLTARYPVDVATKGIWMGGAGWGDLNLTMAMHVVNRPDIEEAIIVIPGDVGFSIYRKFADEPKLQFAGGDAPLWDDMDFRLQVDRFKDIYLQHVSTIGDTAIVRYDPEFTQLLQDHKIAHRYIYSNGTHGTPILDQNARDTMRYKDTFDCPEADRDNVTPFPAFTQSSGDWENGQHGYFNLGLCWDHAGVTKGIEEIKIPIRYQAITGIGGGFQDQPNSITVTVTPRELKGLDIEGWDWEYLGQTGTIVDGSATVSMVSGSNFGDFTVKKP